MRVLGSGEPPLAVVVAAVTALEDDGRFIAGRKDTDVGLLGETATEQGSASNRAMPVACLQEGAP